jgi:hypothetical protein
VTKAKTPAPIEGAGYSGRLPLRIAPSLHARLDAIAAARGVSLNRLLSELLEQAAATADAGTVTDTHAAVDGRRRDRRPKKRRPGPRA